MPGVFDGLRVLDLTFGVAGPMATMVLADNGAEVWRVERPGSDPVPTGSGATVWHRGKRRAELDLDDPADRATVADLAAGADIVVESFAPGALAARGLDHVTLAARNPRLITCSITGYGRDTRLADRPGYDALVMARTGLFFDQRGREGTAFTEIMGSEIPNAEFGPPDGLRRGADRPGPVFPRSTWPSLGATYLALVGITAALRAREVTGAGQWVETSLLDGALCAVGLNWQRVEHPDAPLYWMWPIDSRSIEGLFECGDGRWVHHWTVRPNWVMAAAAGDTLAVPDADHNYRDDPDRLGMGPEDLLVGTFLYPTLAEAFARFPSADWIALADSSEMGVALVQSPEEALADESFLADGCVVEVDHAEHGRIRHVGNVLEFSTDDRRVTAATAPRGAHTDDARALAARPVPAPPSDAGGRELAHPLAGLRVLDLGLGVAGPFAPKTLADLGADVIKVNAVHDGFWTGTHMGLGTNRGKRSISLNLKDPRGREVLGKLVDTADVVATNWRPGAAARLGLDHETLAAKDPSIVFCNSRGYERGPRSDLPGTDQTAAALTGVEWVDGACDHGNPPLWSRSNMGDTGNALLAAIAMTAALYQRERTGTGQAVSTSIVNAGLLNTSYTWIHADGRPGGREQVDADQYGLSARYRMYPCADGWVCVAALSDSAVSSLVSSLDLDPAVATGPDARLASAVAAALAELTCAAAFARLDGAGVPVEIVDRRFARDVFDDPEARASGRIATTWAAGVGRFEDPGLLVRFSATPGVIRRGPSVNGQHSRELMLELGYTDAEIDTLVAERVVVDQAVETP